MSSFLTSKSRSSTPQQPCFSRSSTASALALEGEELTPRHSTPGSKLRPSVLEYFSTPNSSATQVGNASDTVYTPSRPSLSSSHTHSSTAVDCESPMHKLSLHTSGQSSSRSVIQGAMATSSSLSLWAPPSPAFLEDSRSADLSTQGSASSRPLSSPSQPSLRAKSSMIRIPFAKSRSKLTDTSNHPDDVERAPASKLTEPTRPQVAYASMNSRRFGSVSFATLGRTHKKKTLVISGVGFQEHRKFENVKRWCEVSGSCANL